MTKIIMKLILEPWHYITRQPEDVWIVSNYSSNRPLILGKKHFRKNNYTYSSISELFSVMYSQASLEAKSLPCVSRTVGWDCANTTTLFSE